MAKIKAPSRESGLVYLQGKEYNQNYETTQLLRDEPIDILIKLCIPSSSMLEPFSSSSKPMTPSAVKLGFKTYTNGNNKSQLNCWW